MRPRKLTRELLSEMLAWVEKWGMYPQPCGASKQKFCRAFGVDDNTLTRWLEGCPEFAEGVRKANATFKQNRTEEVANALLKKALGGKYVKSRLTEEGRMEGDRMKTRKAVRVTDEIELPPDTKAAMFVITNLDPDNWKDKKVDELGGSIGVTKPNIVFRDSDGEDGGDE